MIEDSIKHDMQNKHEKYEHHEHEEHEDECECDVIEDVASEISDKIAEEWEGIADYYDVLGTLQECLVEDKHEEVIMYAIKEVKEIIAEEMHHAMILGDIITKLTDIKPMSH